ncbi:MAG: ParB/RepB/Spo0J family partition protein [Clostridiales bacterium]|nr:ParB/RepB/Spo0J family partition protein [Clostridiales bacterium]MDY5467988.1 ParB/RepB/Spo0J family partition protein [Eubacteriales bacterium]
MATKHGLARGLDALLPETDLPAGVTEIAVSQLDPNPDQPRRTFDTQALEALAESIRQAGVLQPLLVVENGARYRIVAGERRYRAARMAGLQSVPCVVRDMTEQERMEAALIENLQREDLNPIEEAAGIRALMEECGYTQELAAKRVGRSRPAVANLLRLLQLPESIRELVKAGELSAGHARVLAGLADESRQLALAERAVREGMSVRELEKLAAQTMEKPAKPEPKPLPSELNDMQERLQNVLGVRTALHGNLKKGKIILQYDSAEELEAIYEAMERLENE